MPLIAIAGHGSRHYAAAAGGDGDNLFVADFSDPDANGTNFYNFANKLGNIDNGEQQDGQPNWQMTHLATGGPTGGPAVRLTELANRYQYPMGWDTPALGGSWSLGDEIYYRVVFRIDDASRFVNGIGNKLIDHGVTGTDRNIISLMSNYEYDGVNGGGTLGWPGAEGGGTRATPSYFGLSGTSWTASPHTDLYGSISAGAGIGFKCGEPSLLTYGNHSSPPAPGPNSAAPTSGWYYVQIMARSGNNPGQSAPQLRYQVWVNNNTEGSPTADQYSWNYPDESATLSPASWGNAVRLGGYAGDQPGPSSDFGFVVAAFEVGRSFRNDWYPT